MASKRRNPVSRILPPKPRSIKRVSHTDKLALISKYQRITDPTDRREISDLYRKYKRYPASLHRKADKETREALSKRGFFVTDKGFFIDVPRDAKRKAIPNTRFRVNKDGTVVFRNHKRRDYIIGFTPKEKNEFALDPIGFEKRKIAELRQKYPELRGKKLQVRLQWGAYQATKDFTTNTHTKKNPSPLFFTPQGGEGAPNKRMKEIRDRLTGFHITVFHKPKGKYAKSSRRTR